MKFTIKDLLQYIIENNIPLDTPIGVHIGRGTILEFINETNSEIDNSIPISDKYADAVVASYNGKGNPMLFIGLIK